jgi:glycosyltransferase involved in cell wall biosynthesis
MRVGQNPAKFVKQVAQPAEVTVTVVSCIPFLSGFYEQSLEVLRACLNSIHENTSLPHDLLVFDNRSCREVRDYLRQAYEQGLIQYLVLSDKNIGKIGAWNFMFGAAQGKYIAFADSDIYFRPGWLEASLELFETFPNVGMVTARPLRTLLEFSSATLDWARRQPEGTLEEGSFLDWETYWEHAQSLGHSEAKARQEYSAGKDYRLSVQGKIAFVGAAHFQFLARREILKEIFPLPSQYPMRGEGALDITINARGLLRLTTARPLVWHMGNRLSEALPRPKATRPAALWTRFLNLSLVRRTLLWLYGRIFRLYFFHVD